MTISDQGWAAITAMESANRAAYRAEQASNNLLISTMMIHLKDCHGMGEKRIAEALGLKRSFVREFLKARKKKAKP